VVTEFVSFYLDERLYGLDIRFVKEIHPNVSIVPVPLSPDHIRGLVNIRGQVVLTMDISVVFGRSRRPFTDTSQVIILTTASEIRSVRGLPDGLDLGPFGDKPVGFLVDRIGDVTRVTRNSLMPAPAHLGVENERFVSHVANPDGDLQIILDARELLLGDRTGGKP